MRQELTITGHADCQTLLEATLLAAVPVDADNVAGLILQALFVLDVLLNTAPEETLRQSGQRVSQKPFQPIVPLPSKGITS